MAFWGRRRPINFVCNIFWSRRRLATFDQNRYSHNIEFWFSSKFSYLKIEGKKLHLEIKNTPTCQIWSKSVLYLYYSTVINAIIKQHVWGLKFSKHSETIHYPQSRYVSESTRFFDPSHNFLLWKKKKKKGL